jgi:hypothetical protein
MKPCIPAFTITGLCSVLLGHHHLGRRPVVVLVGDGDRDGSLAGAASGSSS